MLEDLKQCIEISRQRNALIPKDGAFIPSEEIWDEVKAAYSLEKPGDRVKVINENLCIETTNDASVTISAREFLRCWSVGPYALAIHHYEEIVKNLAIFLGYRSNNSKDGRDLFKVLGSRGWRSEVDEGIADRIDQIIKEEMGLSDSEQNLFSAFLSNKKDFGVGKELSRTDWASAAIVKVGGWLANASDRRGELSFALAKSPRFGELIEAAVASMRDAPQSTSAFASALRCAERIKGGDNILYYGAPGTGKSYTANALGEAEQARTFRTVFHPDMQNSDFVGALKPALDAKGAVTYEFRPGPFARALHFARENPSLRVHLVIEELNRAMAAAVFGELFQLLDRDADGASEYSVDAPSDEFATWYGEGAIALPSNLWILATMNSADQGVYPLDTAFRRRWRQEYVRIDYAKAPDVPVTLATGGEGEIKLPWRQFVENLNAFLTARLDIPEDRLVGPRFVKESELAGCRLPGKLLIYLWDDLLRHHGRHTLFQTSIKSYGQLDEAAANGARFLDSAFLATLLPEVAA